MERPWGILSLFTTSLQVQSVTHVDYTQNSTLKTEEPWETLKKKKKKKKSQEEELGPEQKKYMNKTPKEAFRMKEALWNAKQSKTTE